MWTGRKKSRFSVIDPLKRRKRLSLYSFRIIQTISSVAVLILFYLQPPGHREDVVTETCYPTVTMLLFFRVLTSPTAKISFYYGLYVNTLSIGLYSVIGTNDLYTGLVLHPAPDNIYLHYTRLNLMLLTCFLIIGDVLYTEFFEKNVRLLPEKASTGDALRAKIEIAVKKYKEELALKEQEERGKEKDAVEKSSKKESLEKKIPDKTAPDKTVSDFENEPKPSTSSKKQRWFS